MSEQLTRDEAIVIHPDTLDGDPYEQAPEAESDRLEPAADAAVAVAPVLEDNETSEGRDTLVPEPSMMATGRRALSLDALRGLFMLVITLGFTIREQVFAPWMYHRQNPPPDHGFQEIAGLAWRDLAFPVFLFTMAAALPIVFGRRAEKGEPGPAIVHAALKRGVLLFAFALMIGHSNAFYIGEYTPRAWILGLIGFAIMFLMFTRRPSSMPPERFALIQRFGWLAGIIFVAFSPLIYDSAFDPGRRDLIIAMIAFCSVTGALLWYFTRNRLDLRMVAMAVAVALTLGALEEGWVSTFWWNSPAPWLFEPGWFVLWTVVIPGTIAGDALVRWMRAPTSDTSTPESWSGLRMGLIALIGILFTPVLVVGTYNRWVVETTQVVLVMSIVAIILSFRPTRPGETLVRSLVAWGALFLVLGMLLEPFQGGIKKVPGTLSYYFTMAGNSFMMLTSFAIVVDLFHRQKWVQALIDVGQNPMVAYIAYSVFLTSALGLIPGSWEWLAGSPAQLMLRSALVIVAVVLMVRFLTRRKLFWRS